MKDKITFENFIELSKQLDIRIGKITDAVKIPKSYGLKLTVLFGHGEEDIIKTAFTNLGKTHEPEVLIGIQCPFIMNLEPSTIKGVTSEVMIMVGEHDVFGEQIDLTKLVYGSKLM